MTLFFESFRRAVIDCLRPRVLLASLLPLLIIGLLAWAFGRFGWDAAVAQVVALLERGTTVAAAHRKIQSLGGTGDVTGFLAPLLVMAVSTPVIFVLSLVAVALAMTPALVTLVARRRYPQLARLHGGSVAASVGRHRTALLGMGMVCGWLGAAPSIVWASSLFFAAAFVVLVPVAVWIYTLVFAFSSLWFIHYCLQALHDARLKAPASPQPSTDTDIDTDTDTTRLPP